ncbi:dipeptide ABC transporter ATP-binding protein [Verticiella sediminum]|nr:ABC transporter ATP-binding protein [Verticiella sediminum]
MALLDIEGLRIDIDTPSGSVSAVRDLDLRVEAGECVGIVGESGSGKSLTALSVLRLLPRGARLTATRMNLDGEDLLALDEAGLARRVRGRKVGFVFQEPMTALNPVYSVGRQLAETMQLHGTATRREAWRRGIEMLERVGIPDPQGRMHAYPHELSGGQRQRVVIAAALMNRPALLIADEPTTALDVTIQAQIMALLADLQRELRMGMLLISHNLAVVAAAADRVAVMYAGEVVETAPARSIFADPRHPYTRGLLGALPGLDGTGTGAVLTTIPGVVATYHGTPAGCVFAERCDIAAAPCRTTRPPETWSAPGHASRCLRLDAIGAPAAQAAPRPERSVGEPVLVASGVTRTYRQRRGGWRRATELTALDGVSLTVRAGETLAIVGESGCGKSTLARVLLGLERPDDGSVVVGGEYLSALSGPARARLVQLVFQDPFGSLNPARDVHAAVRHPLDLQRGLDLAERNARASEVLDRVGLPRRLHHAWPGQLSGGQRQRVAIARALVTGPALIVCDEPTSALDVSVQAQILNLLLELRERERLSLLLITHDLAVVAHMADRIAVMQQGRIVESGDARQILQAPRHTYTRTLLAATPRLPAHAAREAQPRMALA